MNRNEWILFLDADEYIKESEINKLYDLLKIIDFHENKVQVLVLERAETFAELVGELFAQISGEEGQFLLADQKEMDLDKCTEIVVNPFSFEINNRKNLNKLYQEMHMISQEEYFLSKSMLNTETVRYLKDISQKLPYAIQFVTDLNEVELFKIYDVKLEDKFSSLLEKLTEYLKILALLRNIRLVILVNLRDYLSSTQVKELYKTVFYYKINVLLVESSQKERLNCEDYHILDEQDCLIEF